MHRDIKLDNILLNNKGECKICDFGVAKLIKHREVMKEHCGTPAYIAPEILLKKGYAGFGVDVWSTGVVLYAMLYGTVPFKGNEIVDLNKVIIKGKYKLKEGISLESREMIKSMLTIDPTKRIKVSEILKNPWLKNVDSSTNLFNNEEIDKIKKEFCY